MMERCRRYEETTPFFVYILDQKQHLQKVVQCLILKVNRKSLSVKYKSLLKLIKYCTKELFSVA